MGSANKPLARWQVIAISVTAAVVFVLWHRAFVYCGSAGQVQLANIERAEKEVPKVQKAIDSEPRWGNVKVSAYTDLMGSVLLLGRVETPDELFRLMRAIADLRLSVPVFWRVEVESERKP